MIINKKLSAVVSAVILFVFYGCELPTDSDSLSTNVKKSIVSVNIAADYSEGNVSLYNIDNEIVYKNLLPIDSDNSVQTRKGCTYILNRTSSSIIKIEGSQISGQTADEVSLGSATNPHDIAFISDTKAYVTQYNSSNVAIYNPETNAKKSSAIDLSGYSPSGSSTPNMDEAVYYDGKVYIGLQKYSDDGITLTENSSIVVINTKNDSVEKEIVLDNKNPQGMSVHQNKLFIACTGAYSAQDGGIEVIDLSNDESDGVLIDESTLSGDVSNIIIINGNKGYAVVAGADWTNSVIPFDPSSGSISGAIPEVGNAALSGLVFDGTYLYIGDRSAASPGLLVIDPSDDSLVSGPHDLGMPPNSIALLEVEE